MNSGSAAEKNGLMEGAGRPFNIQLANINVRGRFRIPVYDPFMTPVSRCV